MSEAEQDQAGVVDVAACGGDPQELGAVCALSAVADHDPVTFGELVLDGEVEAGKRRQQALQP